MTARDTPQSSELFLTQQDIDRLLVDTSPDSRTAVLDRISTHYNENAFRPREREIAEQIFRLLMKDTMVAVREMLAQRIQHNSMIPRDIVLHIAEDVESVALPVLTNSEVFSDADLVAIVESSNEISKLLAISTRQHVSARVSDALIESHYPQVVNSLLTNEQAEISNRGFEKIIDGFRSDAEIMQTMASRKTLPMTIVERLVNEASTAVATQLKVKYKLSDAQIQQDTTSTREDVLLYLLSNNISETEMHALAVQMHKEHRLTPSLIMMALCRGQLLFFTIAIAQLASISIENAKQLVADRGELGFNRLYEKARLPEAMRTATRLVLRNVQQLEHGEAIPGSLLYANQLAEQVLNEVGDESIPYLPHFIALIRQTIHRH